jgi:DMSO/TMAO reductase YedYZ molybdopterin-dependent catalytic subunit
MILRSERFLDLEMPPEFANSWITPVPRFFVRNHMHEPSTVGAEGYELTIGGAVEKPVRLTLDDLSKMESHSVVNTLECAGNGRGLQRPIVPGIQWMKGAVGNAKFSGPRLGDVLQRAGVKSTGKHVMFRGLDEVPGKVPPFIRSIPIEKALDADTLVATHMNGSPLTKDHGFPARALVPGWVGSASCKWLTEIQILEKEYAGNFMKPGYRFPNHPGKPGEAINPDDTYPLTSLQVKSMIANPMDGSSIRGRTVKLQGVAWAGEAEIARVDISTDGGASWHQAKLGHEKSRYAWRLWTYHFKAPQAGEFTALSRATDNQGRTQPQTAVWNPSGYLYNAIDEVKIHVQA